MRLFLKILDTYFDLFQLAAKETGLNKIRTLAKNFKERAETVTAEKNALVNEKNSLEAEKAGLISEKLDLETTKATLEASEKIWI